MDVLPKNTGETSSNESSTDKPNIVTKTVSKSVIAVEHNDKDSNLVRYTNIGYGT